MHDAPAQQRARRAHGGSRGKGITMADTPTITPKALAAELNIDPKRLRGWLRKEHSRVAEAKNTSWAITADVADAARARFTPANDEGAETTEA